MYQQLQGNFITGKHPVMFETTWISLYILPNSTVALRVLRKFLNMTNLKQLEFKIFFSSQPSALKREVTQPSFTRKFYENSPFVKQKYFYVESLPTISEQCATMLNAILIVTTHAIT